MQEAQPRTPTELERKLMSQALASRVELMAKTARLAQLPESGLDIHSDAWQQLVDGRWSEAGIAFADLTDECELYAKIASERNAELAETHQELSAKKVLLQQARQRRQDAEKELANAKAVMDSCSKDVHEVSKTIICARANANEAIELAMRLEADKNETLQKWLRQERSVLSVSIDAQRSPCPHAPLHFPLRARRALPQPLISESYISDWHP